MEERLAALTPAQVLAILEPRGQHLLKMLSPGERGLRMMPPSPTPGHLGEAAGRHTPVSPAVQAALRTAAWEGDGQSVEGQPTEGQSMEKEVLES